MKHLLFYLTRYPGVGGIENVTSMIIAGFSKEYRCSVVSHLSDDSLDNTPQDIDLLKLPEESFDSTTNRAFLIDLLSGGKFDIVIYQDSYAPTERMVTDCCRQANVPLIVAEHNSPLFVENKRTLEPWYASVKSLMRRVIHSLLMHKERARKRLLLDAATRYVLLSREFFKEFARIAGVNANHPKLLAINNPAPPI